MFSRIVHPTDLSDASVPALKTAHDLAKALGSELLVCFIAHPPLVADGETLTDPTKGESRDIAAEIESHQPEEQGVKRSVRILVTEKTANVKQLLGILQAMDTDLLVLGMHQRAGIAGWFGHSVTEEVVRLAKCPVMVVKEYDAEVDAEVDTDGSEPEVA
ncbi:MAG: universal stress protein [Rubripirellula sp.]